jgi:hypothetical protein
VRELFAYFIGFLILAALVSLAVQGVLLYICGRWFVPVVAGLTVGLLFAGAYESQIFCAALESCNYVGDAAAPPPILVVLLLPVWIVTALATSIVHVVREHRREQADSISKPR